MTVRLASNGEIELDGVCPSGDAESLQQHLIASPHARINWRTCEAAHTAVIQILLASMPPLHGPPAGTFLRDYVAPLLQRRGCELIDRESR